MNFQVVNIYKTELTTTVSGNQKASNTLFMTVSAEVLDVPDNLRYSEQFRDYKSVMKFKINNSPNAGMIDTSKSSYILKYKDVEWRFTQSNLTSDRQSIIFTVYNDGNKMRA